MDAKMFVVEAVSGTPSLDNSTYMFSNKYHAVRGNMIYYKYTL